MATINNEKAFEVDVVQVADQLRDIEGVLREWGKGCGPAAFGYTRLAEELASIIAEHLTEVRSPW